MLQACLKAYCNGGLLYAMPCNLSFTLNTSYAIEKLPSKGQHRWLRVARRFAEIAS